MKVVPYETLICTIPFNKTIDKYSTTLLGDCITSSFLVLIHLKLCLNTTVSYIEGYFDAIDSKSKQYKQECHVIPCFIHKLDGTPAILSLIDVPLKYCLQLIHRKVGVNLVGQEFLWNDKFIFQTNYGIDNNGSTDHDCLKVADYPFFEIFEFKEDDFRKKFAPQFEKLFNEPILLFNYESLKMKQNFSIGETLGYNIEDDFQKDFLQFCEKNEVMKELELKKEYEQVKKILSENDEKQSKERID
eukprot:gene4312-7668_t